MKKIKKFYKYIKDIGMYSIKWNSLGIGISIVTTLIAIVAVSLILVVLNKRFNEALYHTSQETNEQVVKNIKKNIDDYLGEMDPIFDRVNQFVNSNDENKDGFLNHEFIMRNDINTIAVFDKEGNIMMKSNQKPLKENINVLGSEWFNSIAPGSRITHYTRPHVQRLYSGEYPWIISFSKGLEWESQGKKNWGIVLIDMNFNNIKDLCASDLGDNGNIYILDENNDIIYHPKQQSIYAGIKDETIPYAGRITNGTKIEEINGEKYVISVSPLRSNHWRIVGASRLNGISYYDSDIYNFIVTIFCVLFLIIILVSSIVSFLIARPIRKLANLMEKAETGNFTIHADINGYYEMKELSRSFNTMIYKIQKLMKDVIKKQELLRKSEMKTLHSQINSHFLYNTLDSIIWMVESSDNTNAVKMLSALAEFFRLSISSGRDIISVEEECRHVENYLIIQKMRFDEQFDYDIVIDDNVKYAKTIKMILQPIVENSILHGVSRLPYKGKISIQVKEKLDKLLFIVEDNGFGMEPKKIDNILQIETKSKSGIGIRNVNQRIQLMYGDEYGLQYESELDEGTSVFIWLPLDKGGYHNEKE